MNLRKTIKYSLESAISSNFLCFQMFQILTHLNISALINVDAPGGGTCTSVVRGPTGYK